MGGTWTLFCRHTFEILLAKNDPNSRGLGASSQTAAIELVCPLLLKFFTSTDCCPLVTLEPQCISLKHLLDPFSTSLKVTSRYWRVSEQFVLEIQPLLQPTLDKKCSLSQLCLSDSLNREWIGILHGEVFPLYVLVAESNLSHDHHV